MQTTASVLPEQATLLKRAAIVAVFAITVFCVKVFQLLWIGSLTLETDVGAYFSGAQRLRDGLSLYPPDMDITMSREQYVYPGLYHVLTFRQGFAGAVSALQFGKKGGLPPTVPLPPL